MQRLNIPLARHTKTTRRDRRVVWLLVFVLLVFGALMSRAGSWWFSRDAIFSLAPARTVLAIEFQVNRSTAPVIARLLDGVPLISQRSLELSDLLPFIRGSVAIFVTDEGNQSVGVRLENDDLPDFLDAYGIVSQKQGRYALLSNTLMPVSGLSSNVRKPFLPSAGKAWLGRIELPDMPLGGSIVYDGTDLSMEFRKNSGDGGAAFAGNGNVALSLALRLSGESVLPAFERLIKSFSDQTRSGWPNIRALNEVAVQVRSTDVGLETLLVFKDAGISKQDVIEQLQIMGAFSRPVIDSTPLPDGTRMQEILVQPEMIPVEEISTGFGLGFRVRAGSGRLLIAAWDDENLLFANSEELLEDYAKQKQGQHGAPAACAGNGGHIDPSFLLSQIDLQRYDPNYNALAALFDEIPGISVEFKKYSNKVIFCLA